jgi:cobalt/nickel transport protein
MTSYNRKTLLVGLGIALAVGGVVSYFASPSPDGLESTQEQLKADEATHGGIEVPPVAFKEYNLRWLGEGFWSNAVAGVTGTLLVLAIVLGIGRLLRPRGRTSPPSAGADRAP